MSKREAILQSMDALQKFAESDWWARPLDAAEKRVKFEAIEHDMESGIERTRKTLDKEWTRAIKEAKQKLIDAMESPTVSPREILKIATSLKLDLEGFNKELLDGALIAYQAGQKQAEEEVVKPQVQKFADTYPELQGSEKQKKWASDIRENAIKRAREHIKKQSEDINDIGKGAFDLYKDLLLNLGRKTDSRFWIDNRNLVSGASWIQLSMSDFSGRYVESVLEDLRKGLSVMGYQAKQIDIKEIEPPKQDASKPQVAPEDPYKLGNYQGLLEARAFIVSKGMEEKALQAIANEVTNIYGQGLEPRDATKKIDELFKALEAGQLISPGTPGYDYTKPAIQETTVRTVLSDAMGAGRNDMYERNAGFVLGTMRSEVAEGKDFSVNGKLRSHPLSKWVDGLKIKLSDPRRRRLTGALHFNERGVDIPLTRMDEPIEWSSDADIDRALSKGKELSPRFF